MKIALVGATLSILLVGFLWFTFSTVFPILPTVVSNNYLIPEQATAANQMKAVGYSLWYLRGLDLFILAVILFVSVVGSIAMLGSEEKTK